MQTLFECPHLVVSFRPDERCIALTWAPLYTPSRELRPLLAAVAEALRARRVTRWLCDHSALRIIGPEDLAWIVGSWLPSWAPERSEGGCALAVVQPTDFFGRRSTTRFAEMLRSRLPHVRIGAFEARSDAEAWLRRLVPEGPVAS